MLLWPAQLRTDVVCPVQCQEAGGTGIVAASKAYVCELFTRVFV